MTETGRLPRTVLPRRYDLLVVPDLDASNFDGRVVIALEVVEPTDTVVLHTKELDVDLDELAQDGPVGATLTVDADAERIVVRASRSLSPGGATLALSFRGKISPGLLGFYRSTFVDEDGNERVLAATQFEAAHARRAFPCFDEPGFKAVFVVTLVVADGLLAISNGPEVSRARTSDGRVRVTFAPTIPMSTYLVAYVVGPLELTPPVDAGGVALRVAHAPGRGHLTRFALEVASFALTFFADYYGIPYPGEKCDLVALPDFSFGAMENLGCITFREARLLLDPEKVTLDETTSAALTIVHEIAHMWFGDLVTMKWWNGIWLNEAFATFMEHLGLDAYRPEWKTWDDFALSRAAALDVDALSNTRTVEYQVRTPEDADGMFDVLTYQKGGSVLRMLERWLGADAFRAGVHHYLALYQLANTETTDLWDALEEATGRPVRRIMDSWIFQPGFPVVRASEHPTQRRFAYAAVDGHERWAIPMIARVHDGNSVQTRSLLLEDDDVTLDVPSGALVVLDAGGEGFYRVAYPRDWRDRLVDARVLAPLERAALVDDLWAFVLAGDAPAAELVALARRFEHEDDLVVWRVLLAHLRSTGRLVTGEALACLRADVGALVGPTFAELGWEPKAGEDARRRRLRGLLIDVLGTFVEDPDTIARARDVAGTRRLTDADVTAACVSVVASAGTADDFEHYLDRSRDATNLQEQLRYLYALGQFPDAELVLRAARLAASDAVRPQNAPFVLQRALRNRDHGPLVWAFVRDHWDELCRRFPAALVARVVEGVAWLVDDASAEEIPHFMADHSIPEAARVITQHVERLRVHRATLERERDRFATALLAT